MDGTRTTGSFLVYHTRPSATVENARCGRIGTGSGRPRPVARALADGQMLPAAAAGQSGAVPRRMLGKTGVEVSALCFGGAHLGRIDGEAEAIRVLHEAIDAGITFLDNAWEYNHGVSEERMGKGLQGRRHQVFLMTKVCSHGRGKQVAMQQLEESLRRLRTDYLDLWQIHEVIYANDPDRHFAPGGVIEAMLEAKRQGKVRFLGFTGHKDPAIHLKMLQHDFRLRHLSVAAECFRWDLSQFRAGRIAGVE